jgi:hypothetical protein
MTYLHGMGQLAAILALPGVEIEPFLFSVR